MLEAVMGTTGRRVAGATLLLVAIVLLLPFLNGLEDASNGKEGPGVLLSASLAITVVLSLWFLIKKAPDPKKMSPKKLLHSAIGSRTIAMIFFMLPIFGGLTALVVGLVFFDLDPEMDRVGWAGAIFAGFCFSILMLFNLFALKAIWDGSGPPAYRIVARLLRQPTTIAKVTDFQMHNHQDGSPMNQGDVYVHFMEGDEYHFFCGTEMAERIIEVLRAQMRGEQAPAG